MGPQSEGWEHDTQPGNQPLPVDFTNADSLRLQQLNQGLSTISQQLADGEILPEHASQLQQQVMAQKVPLTQKQNAAAEAAKKFQTQKIQEDSAQAQGMAHADAVYRAKGLPDRMVPVSHPVTGELALFYEDGAGGFIQAQFAGQPVDPTKVASASPPTAPIPGLPEGAPAPGGAGGPSISRVTSMADDGSHTLEIWNGPNLEQVQFDGRGQIVDRKAYDPSGNLVVGPQGMAALAPVEGQLQPHEIQYMRQQAEQLVPQVPKPEGPMTPLMQQRYDAAVAARSAQVGRVTQGFANKRLQEQAAATGHAWRAQENQAQAARKEQLLKEQTESKKSLAETRKQKQADLLKLYETAQKHLHIPGQAPPNPADVWKHVDEIMKGHEERLPKDPEATAEEPKPAATLPGAKTPITEEALAAPSKLYNPKAVQALQEAAKNWKVEGGQKFLGITFPTIQTEQMKAKIGEVRSFLNKIASRGNGMTVGERAYYEKLLNRLGDDKVADALRAKGEVASGNGNVSGRTAGNDAAQESRPGS